MPFHQPFNFPYFLKPNYKWSYQTQSVKNQSNTSSVIKKNLINKPIEIKSEDSKRTQNCSTNESSEYFFEIFGLKLYFDDILIICLIYFLYTEGIQDQELFICLILLLIS